LRLTVEKAELGNLDELVRIERECFTSEAFTKEQVEIMLRNQNAIALLARINDEAAGFIIGIIENYGTMKAGHIYTIDVAVKHRRRGVGKRLLEEMESISLMRGAETSYLEVKVDNSAARRLYRNQGYVKMEPLHDYYSSGVHGLRLKKQLKPG